MSRTPYHPDAPHFRTATQEDAPAMVRTLQAAFTRWPAVEIDVPAVNHLLWKMNSPDSSSARHIVGVIGADVAVVELRWVGPVLVRGHQYFMTNGADLAIHPSHQSRGLKRVLSEHEKTEGIEGDLGISTPSRNERNQRHPEDEAVRHIARVWVRAFRLRTLIAAPLRGSGPVHLLRTLARLLARRVSRSTPPPVPDILIDEINRFDLRVDSLWEATCGEFDVIRVRGREYLNWRYADPRGGRALIVGAFQGPLLLGYAVFKQSGHWGAVVDILIHPEHIDVAAGLLEHGATTMRARGCRGMKCWLPAGHPVEAALAAAGFFDDGAGVVIEIEIPAGCDSPLDLAEFRDPALRYHLTMGDFDFF